MTIEEVKVIFNTLECTFSDELNLLKKNNPPIAIILGGQPATGKGALAERIKSERRERGFFGINGDEFRIHHPLHDDIIKNDVNNYSVRTQIFSNVFTESLIKKVAGEKNDVIVEGTMRSPDVVINTAQFFFKNGYTVEVHLLAAHPLISELSIYSRYQEQLEINGAGRLAEIKSHNDAANGLIITADTLYKNKSVDQISIYSLYAEKLIKEYHLNSKNEWNCMSLPSLIIEKERVDNTRDMELLSLCIKKCNKLKFSVSKDLKDVIKNIEMRLLETQKRALIFNNKKGHSL